MKIRYFFILVIGFIGSAFAQDNTWSGLKIEKEIVATLTNRSEDYVYSQTIENQTVKSLGNKIYPNYSGKFFKSQEETDIEPIVSLSEAHDSDLYSADKKTKTRFASNIQNLTLASSTVNRDEKSGYDASGWFLEKNKYWFANKVIEVKKAYNLTADSNLGLNKAEYKQAEVDFKKADDTGVTEEGKKIIISANNKFALNLYSYLNSKNSNENIFFSPYGIFTAMAMTYEGANGQTAKEIHLYFTSLKTKKFSDQQ